MLLFRSQESIEPLEAGLPSQGDAGASLARGVARVTEREARAPIEALQDVCHRGRPARRPIPDPGVHELPRRIDLEDLALESVGLTVDGARRVPAPADAHIARP